MLRTFAVEEFWQFSQLGSIIFPKLTTGAQIGFHNSLWHTADTSLHGSLIVPFVNILGHAHFFPVPSNQDVIFILFYFMNYEE